MKETMKTNQFSRIFLSIVFLLALTFASQPGFSADLIDINNASKAELTELTGVGGVIAQRIVDFRLQSPFESVDELVEVKGIGPATLAKIRDQITVTPASG